MAEGDDILKAGMLTEESGVDPVFSSKWSEDPVPASEAQREELRYGRMEAEQSRGGPELHSEGLASLRGTDEYANVFRANLQRLRNVSILPALPDWSGETKTESPMYGGGGVAIDTKWGESPYYRRFSGSDAERIRKLALAEALVAEHSRRGSAGDWMTYKSN